MKGCHAAPSVNSGLDTMDVEAGSVWKKAASWINYEGKGFKTVGCNSGEGKILSSQASLQAWSEEGGLTNTQNLSPFPCAGGVH